MFGEWLFIDKADLLPEAKQTFHGATFKGTMERLVDWEWIRYLSICYTPVSKTILNRCPNLKWVMVRGTANEKVDMIECRKRGVGVAEAIPTHNNCADYLVTRLGAKPWLFYGYGNIGKLAAEKAGAGCFFINTKTKYTVMEELVNEANTIAMSVSFRKGQKRPPVFGRRFFRAMSKDTKLVSVCRPGTTDNEALLIAVRQYKVREAIMDTLGKNLRKELLATGKVVDTGHIAWLTGMDRDDFFKSLKVCATSLMGDAPIRVVLPRRL